MRSSRLPSLALALVALLAAALAPLLAASPARAGDVGRPDVGSCHDLTLKQASQPSDNRDPVACSRRHTTLTTAVRKKPEGLSWNSQGLVSFSVAACQKAVITYFGEDSAEPLARSAYQLLFFYPTQAQRDAGADWVRCDLSLRGDITLLKLRRGPKLGASSKLCLAPRSRDYAHTVCSRPHSFRSVGTVQSRHRLYPSKKSWQKLSAGCPSRGRYYLYPSRPEFKAGSTYLTCLAKTSH